MKGHCILSHGFESGPDATKVTALAQVAEALGWSTERPDYTAFDARTEVTSLGDVPNRRLHLRERIKAALPNGRLVLAGSSLGSYISGMESVEHRVAGLFLMAPPIFRDYGTGEHVLQAADVPITVIHPWDDELIPYQHVVDWAHERRAKLILVNDTHRLADHVNASAQAFRELLESLG